MKKILILLSVTILLFSSCIDQKTENQKTIKIGNNVSVNYIGSLNGKVFDTSIGKIARENNLYIPNKTYMPTRFTVGKGQIIKGFEENIIGMKVGESKTFVTPPEKAYGQKNPRLVQTIPIIQYVPITRTFPKIFEIPFDKFELMFGFDHKIGDNVEIPNENINLTILNINTTSNVSVSYNLSVGSKISLGTPWNDTVIKIGNDSITTRTDVKQYTTYKFEGVPWTTTVVNLDSDNMTLKHNNIPDTTIQNGSTRVHFNNTHIIMDKNDELVGETLVFNVIIESID